jgi:hypothetical protein
MKNSEALARMRGAPSKPSKPEPLAKLAKQINAEHRAVGESIKAAMAHALRAGELLLGVKARLPHGDFIPWIEENCEFNRRSASGYMLIAANGQHVGFSESAEEKAA